jgi:hypothetical protein
MAATRPNGVLFKQFIQKRACVSLASLKDCSTTSKEGNEFNCYHQLASRIILHSQEGETCLKRS